MRWVAVGEDGVFWSKDGIEWSASTGFGAQSARYAARVGNRVAVANDTMVWLSDAVDDGSPWISTLPFGTSTTTRITALGASGSEFVAGGRRDQTGLVALSVDGSSWATETPPDCREVRTIPFVASRVLLTGILVSQNRFSVWSRQGGVWVRGALLSGDLGVLLTHAIEGTATLVGIGAENAVGAAFQSTDAERWQGVGAIGDEATVVRGIAYDGFFRHVVAGTTGPPDAQKGWLFVSFDDGVTWAGDAVLESGAFEAVAWGHGQFVAVGRDGVVATSQTGEPGTWQLGTIMTGDVFAIVVMP